MGLNAKVLEVLSKGLGLEAPDPEAVKARLAELEVPEGALFTQTDVNAFIADDKKRVRKENEELKARLDAQNAALQDQSQKLDDFLGRLQSGYPISSDGADRGGGQKSAEKSDDPAAVVVGVEKRVQAQIQKLEGALERQGKVLQEERKLREQAERLANDKERDGVLIAAARRAGLIEPERNAPLFFAQRLRKDDKGAWTFMRDDELPADSIEEGIAEALTKLPYLRETKSAGGGGTGGPGAINPLKEAEEALKRAQEEARANPRSSPHQTKLLQAQRKLAALKAGRKT